MAFLDSIINGVTNPLVIISLILWIIFYIIVKYTKNGKKYFHIMFPFVVLLKTERFNQFFKKLASKGKTGWIWFFNAGIVVSFAAMIFALYFFINNLFSLVSAPKLENAVSPLIPGVTVSFNFFSYLLIPIVIILTIHETCHAVASEIDGIKVKSSGLLAAGILVLIGFGAFVELNEHRIYAKDIKRGTRLRIMAAGVMGNFVTAGIVFLMVLNFGALMSVGYTTSSFQITYVLPESEGGFNQHTIQAGDIVLDINGTIPDYENGITLNEILGNKTALKVSPGDTLAMNVRPANSKQNITRMITLGHHWFVGFEWRKVNNTAIEITRVYPRLNGGNNEENIAVGIIITHINSTPINYELNQTLGHYLLTNPPKGQILLGADNGSDYLINLDNFPRVPAAFVLKDVFIGLDYNKTSNTSINITKVLKNSTENGVNEGNIPEGVSITKINGISLDLTNKTLAEWVEEKINPSPGDTLVFTTENNTTYYLSCIETPFSYVFMGVKSDVYWVEKNWWGDLFGGKFPEELRTQLIFIYLLSFSIAIFNMLPAPIFDGGRLFQEMIDYFVGSEYVKGKKKKMTYEVHSETNTIELGVRRVEDIENIRLFTTDEYNQLKQQLSSIIDERVGDSIISQYGIISRDYEKLDNFGVGHYDTIKINQKPDGEKYYAMVEMVHEEDIREPKKKLIFKWVSIVVIGILLANFLLSYIFLGNPLMGL